MVPSERIRASVAELTAGVAPLIEQLRIAVIYGLPKPKDSGGGGKPDSRPPIHMAPFNLLDEIHASTTHWHGRLVTEAAGAGAPATLRGMVTLAERLDHTHGALLEEYAEALAGLVKRARLMLGIDAPEITLADTVCGECSGQLVTREDASASVVCVGCGQEYPRESWPQLAQDLNLIRTEEAVTYLMRDGLTRAGIRKALYRAAADGRIRNRGGSGKGEALWALEEISSLDGFTCPI